MNKIVLKRRNDMRSVKMGMWFFSLLMVFSFSAVHAEKLVGKEESNWSADEDIFKAAQYGDLQKVKELVTQDPTLIKSKGETTKLTPLHRAAQGGHLEICEFLVAKGAEVNAKSNSAETPLHLAAQNGHGKICELLIAKGAEVKAKESTSGSTALHLAARGGKMTGGFLPPPPGSSPGHTHEAEKNDYVEVIKILLDHGTGVNVKDASGYTPLNGAAGQGFKEGCEILIQKGADVNLGNPLSAAAYNGHKDIGELLLNRGANAKAKDKDGLTPLHYAALNGHEDIGELLLNHGADAKAKAMDGITPLLFAARAGNKPLCELLIAKGADVNALNNMGFTPLAAAGGSLETATFLLEKGAEVNRRGNRGPSPLHGAAGKGNKPLCELLLAKGAEVNSRADIEEIKKIHPEQSWRDLTPLHLASMGGYHEVCALLIAKGADVNARTKEGKTPLGLALAKDNTEVVELLKKNGGVE
jgi:ankyrin repeat protein